MSKVECLTSNRPRVGHIRFFNCLPLYHGLVKNQVLRDVDLTQGTPAELNRLLLAGKLDISPISSIAYARHQQDLLLMPNLSVSCAGPVKSIYLVSKRPIEELDRRRVALTNTSATSHVLLKIILADAYGVQPRYFEAPPDLGLMLTEADAALLIGDAALQVHFAKPAGCYTYDLGVEWAKLTQRKMVFAVWAIRRAYAAEQPALVREVYRAWVRAMTYGVEHVADIAREAAREASFDADFLADYFTTLQFGLEDAHCRGLMEYYRRAGVRGHLDRVPSLDFLEGCTGGFMAENAD